MSSTRKQSTPNTRCLRRSDDAGRDGNMGKSGSGLRFQRADRIVMGVPTVECLSLQTQQLIDLSVKKHAVYVSREFMDRRH